MIKKYIFTILLLMTGLCMAEAQTKLSGSFTAWSNGNSTVETNNNVTKITYKTAWEGAGYWIGSEDYSAYDYIWVTVAENSTVGIKMCVEYNYVNSNETSVAAGAVIIGVKLDNSGRSSVKQFFLQSTTGEGSLTVTGAYVGTEAEYNAAVEESQKTRYTATFIIDGNTTTQQYAEGATITPPTAEKYGYTFIGWNPTLPETMPAENVSFTAQFTEDTSLKWSTENSIEAENTDYATYSGNGCVSVSGDDYSGGYAVHMTDTDDKLIFRFDIATAGKYKVTVTAKGDGDGKVVKCQVGGASATFTANSSLTDIDVETFHFDEGHNTIIITPSWTWYYIDKVSITEDESGSIVFSLSDTPVTSDVTTPAQRIYDLLKTNFGKVTLSGVMTGSMDNSDGTNIYNHEDVKAVYTASGKYPALVGFDFMNATGGEVDNNNTWYTGYTQKAISLAKDLWSRGGIPTFCWHWRDPSRSTNYFYSTSASGQTETTSFNFTTAMKSDGSWDTSSTVYQNMINDIDAVAAYFLELQNAGIACIFRPLHEAAGGWFWWGAQGSDNFKKLYKLIYDEMAAKGVRNVLWNYCHVVSDGYDDWVPDADTYDIISCDIYNSANDYQSNFSNFNKLAALSNKSKLIALAECGPIPDIDNQANDEAMWSYWMPWYNSWSGGYVSQTSNDEWTKEMADSRVVDIEGMPSLSTTLTLPDGKSFKSKAKMPYTTASYSRSCSYEWGTLCLPFAYSSDSNVQYYTVAQDDATNVKVSPITDVKAGQPVIYKILSAKDAGTDQYTLNVSAENPTVQTCTYGLTATPVTNWTMKSTYSDTKIQNASPTTEYYIAHNKFWSAKNEATVPAYRAWLEYTGSGEAKASLGIVIVDESTAIDNLTNFATSNGTKVIYNLNGQRISAPQKGINIINGKKIMVR